MKKDVPVAGMEAAKGFNLLSCYRDNCFLTYMYTRDLFRGLSFYNAHDYRPVNLFVNGKYVGSSSGAHLQSEFNLTGFVKEGENEITVLVYKWSAFSYQRL